MCQRNMFRYSFVECTFEGIITISQVSYAGAATGARNALSHYCVSNT